MPEKLSEEQECRRDLLSHLQKLLNMLDERIDALHEASEKQNMRPGECEQAIDRHIVLVLRMLQMRQQFVHNDRGPDRVRLLEEMFAEEIKPLMPS